VNRRSATVDRANREQAVNAHADQHDQVDISKARGRDTLVIAGICGIACIGLIMIVWPRPPLWLDEAQSVAIARRSLPGLVDGLRADGAPPIYYVLLHGWMQVFGHGDVAVRSLSILFALAALAVLAVVAGRALDRCATAFIVLITISHPYFVRYATEARMYALVMLEVALAALCLQQWLLTRRRPLLIGLGLIGWALPLTHYWGVSMAIAFCGCMAAAALMRWFTDDRWKFGLPAVAVAVGMLGTAFWWPILRFQSRHTGTPWTNPSSPTQAFTVVIHRSTGSSLAAYVVSITIGLLGAVALLAATGLARRDDRDHPRLVATSRLLLVVFVATFVLSYAVSRVTDSAFVARYTMTMFPLQLLLAACGAIWLAPRSALAVGAAVWLAAATVTLHEMDDPRTRAPMFADALADEAVPGDVVLYCPDQLGPPVSRLLAEHAVELPQQWTFPEFASPARVDWIDYRQRHDRSSPTAFAAEAGRRAGDHDIWLVLSMTHPPTEAACAGLFMALQSNRPAVDVVIPDDRQWHEHDSLLRFHSGSPAAGS
jgi:mannosyltransferase